MMRRTLVVPAKAPIAGKVKTLLCPPLDARSAARLHEAFVLDTLELGSAVPDTDLIVCYSPTGTLPFFRRAAPSAKGYMLQKGGPTGSRTMHCFDRLLDPERAVVLIGTDTPTLPARSLELAFDALATGHVDLVLGPSNYGGYYLVGMTSSHPELFRNIRYNASGVLDKMIERAARLGLGWYLLPEWYEVRRPMDLLRLRAELLNETDEVSPGLHTRRVVAALAGCHIL